uniref:Uncharacterized protein n=1 Tax=Poecilia mexicana TaxID=48701 RepID=A0A3B3XSY9_9TELE
MVLFLFGVSISATCFRKREILFTVELKLPALPLFPTVRPVALPTLRHFLFVKLLLC